MLVLTRRVNEQIVIDGDIVVTVLEVGRGQVRLGIKAPRECPILRQELIGRTEPAAPIEALPPAEDVTRRTGT